MVRMIFKKIMEKEILRDNFILFSSLMLLNILGYVFHFFAGRKLGPEDYGTFGVLLSILYLFNIILTVVQTSMTKFSSEFKNEEGKLSYLFAHSLKKLSFYGLILTLIYFALSPFIAKFLNISEVLPVFITGTFLFLSFGIAVNRGILQGLQNFKKLGLSYVFEGLTKIFFGILLIYIGWKVNGAVLAITFSYIAAFLIALLPLRKLFKLPKIKIDTKAVYNYSVYVFFSLVLLTLLYTIDVVLVKHFLSATEAGFYVALSLLGKIIFFGTLSVSMVMFPKASEMFEAKEASKSLLYKSLGLVLLFGVPVTLFYFLFPEFSVGLLYGKDYFGVAGYLGYFGIIMTLFSLIYIISFYLLSIKKYKFIYILLGFVVLETALIWLFHGTIGVVVNIMLGLMTLLFLVMVILAGTTKHG
ncbi:MAG: oligosaccharide flippase family protein [Candidatus Nanoarchaeia archaeon]|nr:oligosaccharide flippase family protein [Candidatus Nanoarchaeia archaeon]